MYWLLSIFSGMNVSGLSWEWSKLRCSHPIKTHHSKTHLCVATLSFREHHSPMSQHFLFICRTQGFHALKKISSQKLSNKKTPHGASLTFPFPTLEIPCISSSHCKWQILFVLFWQIPLDSFTPYFTCVPTIHSIPSFLGHSVWKYEGKKELTCPAISSYSVWEALWRILKDYYKDKCLWHS